MQLKIPSYGRIAGLLFLGLWILLFDFLSKAYVYYLFPSLQISPGGYYNALPVFSNIAGVDFSINLTLNRGAAWGLFSQFQHLLIVVRIIVISCLLIYLFFFNALEKAEIPFVLIIAGALGNVIDFFLYGMVVDFLRFNLWGYHFPVFNFADVSITMGVIWLFLVVGFKKKHHSANA